MNQNIYIDFQKIVNRVTYILGKNINIMDSKGIIIASFDKNRINTFHSASKEAAINKKEVIVDETNEAKYMGSKKGVNIPIYHNEEVIGVVGITGNPKEIKAYGLLVKELVEIMISEEYSRRLELSDIKAKESFATELIRDNNDKDLNGLSEKAKLIKFNINLKRMVICCAIKNNLNNLEETLQLIRNSFLNQNDLAFNLEDKIIIIKSSENNMGNYCLNLKNKVFKTLGLNIYIALGSECKSLKDYYLSYLTANNLLNIGLKMNKHENLYQLEDLRLPLILNEIKGEWKNIYLLSYEKIFNDLKEEKNVQIIETVMEYFKNKMNIKNTASYMNLHRNTINYRINRFKEVYNFDITDPYICMQIYIGYEMFVLSIQK